MTERDRERGEDPEPLDEQAAWEQIVAGYGERPAPPPVPGVWHPDAVRDGPARGDGKDAEQGADPDRPADADSDGRSGDGHGDHGDDGADAADTGGDSPRGAVGAPGGAAGDSGARDGADAPGHGADDPAGSDDPEQAVRAGGVNEIGQWSGSGPRDWGPNEPEDEGHFVPPEPPPLPETDLITRFAWIGVIGGPVLLVGCAVLGVDVTWWITTLGVGGFLGGFATLVLGMRDDQDDEWRDPGSGAVV